MFFGVFGLWRTFLGSGTIKDRLGTQDEKLAPGKASGPRGGLRGPRIEKKTSDLWAIAAEVEAVSLRTEITPAAMLETTSCELEN